MSDNASPLIVEDPTLLPMDWKLKMLVEVCEHVTDGSHFSPTPRPYGRPIANVKDLKSGRVDIDSCTKIAEDDYIALERNGCDVRKNDVLLSKDGTIGKVVVYEQDDFLVALSSIAILRPGLSINSSFLGQILQFSSVLRQFAVFASGSALRRLVLRDIKRLQIPLPPSTDQRIIAAILDTMDEVISKTQASLDKLKQVRAGLIQDLLTCGLDENDKIRSPRTHPEQFQEKAIGRFPNTWEIKTLSSLCIHIGSGVTPRGGKDIYTSRGVMFIRSQNVTFDGLLLDDVAFISEEIHLGMLRSEIFAHDVLFNITGASIGRCCAMSEGLGRVNVNQHVCALRLPNATVADAKYLALLLSSPIGQRQMEALNTMGNRQGLNYQQLGAFIIPWPNPGEREQITVQINAIETQVQAEIAEYEKLKLVKSGLMADLLSGRVRVPEALITEVGS